VCITTCNNNIISALISWFLSALRKQAQTASSSSGLERLIQLGTDLIEDVSKLEAKESFFLGKQFTFVVECNLPDVLVIGYLL
jgi:hypothetical protein